MSFNRLHAGVLSLVLGFAAAAWATEATTTPATAPASTEAASQATSEPATRAASDKDGIDKLEGQEVAVTGKVGRVSATSNGSITFINFDGNQRGDFVAIIRQANLDAVNKGFDGDVAKAIADKKITVTGKVTKYRGSSQIEVVKPEQLTVIKE